MKHCKVPSCERPTDGFHGMCRKHRYNLRKYGTLEHAPPAWPERFRAKYEVNPLTGCWEWQATCSTWGYGRYRIPGVRTPSMAHRVSYELHVGPIPDGLQLDHLCRVRSCVNPAHLEPVTCAENLRRSREFWAAHSGGPA